MSNPLRVGLGSLLALALASLPAAGKSQEVWTASYPLSPGGRVVVTNVQGSIQVVGWEEAAVELKAVKNGSGAEALLSDASIVVQSKPDSLVVRTLYRGQSDDPVKVDYYLHVPRHVHLEELRTVNGNIVVRDVEGSVTARTLNGSIEEKGIAGSVVARTVNGSVRVALRALPDPEGTLKLDAINGDIYLSLPSDADVELEMSTVAGRMESARSFLAAGARGDDAVRTRLGRGGLHAFLRTIRGNIRVVEGEDVL